ncbi:basic proline-rich protein-like [Caloenas nicobarica]|uniref:basic proline-rich protein-like n=1 Tax=Caloenas nicobarica TaxID=187106 RepID=UPI0032B7DFF7
MAGGVQHRGQRPEEAPPPRQRPAGARRVRCLSDPPNDSLQANRCSQAKPLAFRLHTPTEAAPAAAGEPAAGPDAIVPPGSLPPPAKPTPPPLPPGVKPDKEKRGVLEPRRGRTAAARDPGSPFGAARNHSKWRPRHHSRLNPPAPRTRRPPRPLAPARPGGSYRRPVEPRALRGAPPHTHSPLPGHLTADAPPGGSPASVRPLSSPAFPSAGPPALRAGLRPPAHPPPCPQRFARWPPPSAGGARAAPWRRAAAASPRPLPGRYLGPGRRRRAGGSRRGPAPRTPLGGGGRLRPFSLPLLRLLSSFVFDVRSGAAIPVPPSWSGCRGSGADSRTGGSSGFARGQRLPAEEGAQSGGEGKKGANPEVHPPRRRPQGNTRAQTQQCGATSPPPPVTSPPASEKPACRSLLAAARGRRAADPSAPRQVRHRREVETRRRPRREGEVKGARLPPARHGGRAKRGCACGCRGGEAGAGAGGTHPPTGTPAGGTLPSRAAGRMERRRKRAAAGRREPVVTPGRRRQAARRGGGGGQTRPQRRLTPQPPRTCPPPSPRAGGRPAAARGGARGQREPAGGAGRGGAARAPREPPASPPVPPARPPPPAPGRRSKLFVLPQASSCALRPPPAGPVPRGLGAPRSISASR